MQMIASPSPSEPILACSCRWRGHELVVGRMGRRHRGGARQGVLRPSNRSGRCGAANDGIDQSDFEWQLGVWRVTDLVFGFAEYSGESAQNWQLEARGKLP